MEVLLDSCLAMFAQTVADYCELYCIIPDHPVVQSNLQNGNNKIKRMVVK